LPRLPEAPPAIQQQGGQQQALAPEAVGEITEHVSADHDALNQFI